MGTHIYIYIYSQNWDPYIYIARCKKYLAWCTFPCVSTLAPHQAIGPFQPPGRWPGVPSQSVVSTAPPPPHTHTYTHTHTHTPSIIQTLSLINELGRFWNFAQLGSCDRDSFMSGSFAQCDDSDIQLCVNQQFAPLIGWMFTWRWTVGCFQVWLI